MDTSIPLLQSRNPDEVARLAKETSIETLCREAERILPILQERQRRENGRETLLRASDTTPASMPDQLLRPHTLTTAEAPSHELLRPHRREE